MTLTNPGIDAQHIINRAMGAQNLGALGKIQNEFEWRNITPEAAAARARQHAKEEAERIQTTADTVLNKIGYLVKHKKDGTRVIEKYNSGFVRCKLKQFKLNTTEDELLRGVTGIKGHCDLTQTTVKDLSTLKKIGGSLYLDVRSPLKNLSGIKEVTGSVVVNVKNKADAKSFLQSLGLSLEAIKGQIVPVLKMF